MHVVLFFLFFTFLFICCCVRHIKATALLTPSQPFHWRYTPLSPLLSNWVCSFSNSLQFTVSASLLPSEMKCCLFFQTVLENSLIPVIKRWHMYTYMQNHTQTHLFSVQFSLELLRSWPFVINLKLTWSSKNTGRHAAQLTFCCFTASY